MYLDPSWNKRQEVWRHNSFIGSACMMRMQALVIIQSRTAMPLAKKAAKRILRDATKLEKYLRAGRVRRAL